MSEEIKDIKEELARMKAELEAMKRRNGRRGCENCAAYNKNGGACWGTSDGTCTWFRTRFEAGGTP